MSSNRKPPARTFQELILRLQNYWAEYGCVLGQPFDVEKGAGTFNPHTFLRALGPEPWMAAYVEPSRRPTDGRYGDDPNRLYRHHQFQVVLKPNPPDVQRIYLESMATIGIHPEEHDIRFVEDNWASPTLGAWGLGWEVWVDGMELTQFTYFQQCGGLECRPVTAELTYGLERIAMYLQRVDNVYDLEYAPGVKYREVFHEDEVQYSKFTFEMLDVKMYQERYEANERECNRLVECGLVIPAYDHLLSAAHAFNSLDAKGAISVTERQGYILRIRDLAKLCADAYLEMRERLGFPLMREGTTNLGSMDVTSPLDEEPRGNPHAAELLVEVGSEELPAAEVMPAVFALRDKLVKDIEALGLTHGEPQVFATPRRIAVAIPNIPDRQEDQVLEHEGPPVKAGDVPAQKFAEKHGLTVAQLKKKQTKKAEKWLAVVERKGRATAHLLSTVVRDAVASVPFKKTMRWGTQSETFARPIRWIVSLYDGRRVPMEYAGIRADRISEGHRFLAPHQFRVENAAQYVEELARRHVVADVQKRRQMVLDGAAALAEKAGGQLRKDDDLIDEITQLVENPVPLLNHFDTRFLEIPDEVLISEMQHHQRYLPVVDKDGKLRPNFIVVANTTVEDEKVSLDGYRRVLTARFEDGAFFFREDQKKPLFERVDKLKDVRFHRALGSIHDKVERVVRLAYSVAGEAAAGDTLALAATKGSGFLWELARAGWLMKADLTSQMVFEFPELQGVMGAEYAQRGGEPEVIARAIEEHYLPRGADDDAPSGRLGSVLGVADRLDSIAGIFSVSKGPSGSADPFGLRRAAMGIITILRARDWHLSLAQLVDHAVGLVGDKRTQEGVEKTVLEFFRARLKGVCTGEGVPTDVTEAVLSAGYDDMVDAVARAKALAELRKSPDFEPIAVTFKRVANILRQAREKKIDIAEEVDPSALTEEVEKKLFAAISEVSGVVAKSIEARNFDAAFGAIADLRPVVAEFFGDANTTTAVKVMDDDPAVRRQRTGLVLRTHDIFAPLADFTKLS